MEVESMEVKIEVRTPKGQAKATLTKLKRFLIGFNKVKVDAYVNQTDNIMYLEINGKPRAIVNIMRNVSLFDRIINGAFNNPVVQKMVKKTLSKDQQDELEYMLLHQTKVKVIKKASAEELVEKDLTLWQKVKKTFLKINPSDKN